MAADYKGKATMYMWAHFWASHQVRDVVCKLMLDSNSILCCDTCNLYKCCVNVFIADQAAAKIYNLNEYFVL